MNNNHVGRWLLAVVTVGVPTAHPLESGRHVYVRRTAGGLVHVLAQRDTTAVLTVAEACRRVNIVRDHAGDPVAVRGQDKQSERWRTARHGRELRLAA